mgnify:CR=1 FL=1
MKKRFLKLITLAILVAILIPGTSLISNAGGYEGEDITGYNPKTNEYFRYYWNEDTETTEKTYWQWDYDFIEEASGYRSVKSLKNTQTGEILKNGWYLVDGEDTYFDANGYVISGFINGRMSDDAGWELGYETVYKTDPSGLSYEEIDKLEKVNYGWITDANGSRYGATGYYYDSSSDNWADHGYKYGTYYLKGTVSFIIKDNDFETLEIDGKEYKFNADGYIATEGWFDDGYKYASYNENGTKTSEKWVSRWKYVTSDGSLATGWTEIGGYWYYFDSQKEMVSDQIVDGYFIDDTGVIAEGKGWYNNWYWLDEEKGTWEDRWIYIDSDGYVKTGWAEIDGEWYYFSNDKYSYGVMLSSAVRDGYYLTEDGTLAKGGWYSDWYWISEAEGTWDYTWRYTYSDGSVASGWTKIDGTWYYIHTGSDSYDIDGTTYYYWYSYYYCDFCF